uniref:AlNc14C29G2755 protein n=1 Tax=Albugo laibachii Nc14 TaxID=890382 RepID=F0W7E0_9STRA|nr:AlNc14C29G2755 [Albugo laibachii Nc14]|eukprot:CCA17039.1 AlNc14C29G2755 [Albugo laibachii Nc14]
MCEYLKSMTAHRRTINIDPGESSSIGAIPPKVKKNTAAGRLETDQSAQGPHILASTHFYRSPLEDRIKKRNLREAIRHISGTPCAEDVWFLQFHESEGGKGEPFKTLAFCIAAINSMTIVKSPLTRD